MAERREDLRAADKDREFVAEQLRQALDEGRLNLAEYDERLQQAYAARTYGDLDGILDDLPGVRPVADSQVVPTQPGQPATAPAAGRPGQLPHWLWAVWGSWVSVAVITIVVWAISGGGDFWPIWVIAPWGALMLVRTLGGLASGAHRTPPAAPDAGGDGHPTSGQAPRGLGDDLFRARRERERRRADRHRRRFGDYR